MSGGSFNYAYGYPSRFADELEEALKSEEQCAGIEAGGRARMEMLVHEARKIAELMRAAEWYFSGDIGEETFLKRVAKAEEEYRRAMKDPT